MTDDDPVMLDEHRGMATQKATEIRRRLSEVHTKQAALCQRQAELEAYLIQLLPRRKTTEFPPPAAHRQCPRRFHEIVGLTCPPSVLVPLGSSEPSRTRRITA
jgi:hypothetical protein